MNKVVFIQSFGRRFGMEWEFTMFGFTLDAIGLDIVLNVKSVESRKNIMDIH